MLENVDPVILAEILISMIVLISCTIIFFRQYQQDPTRVRLLLLGTSLTWILYFLIDLTQNIAESMSIRSLMWVMNGISVLLIFFWAELIKRDTINTIGILIRASFLGFAICISILNFHDMLVPEFLIIDIITNLMYLVYMIDLSYICYLFYNTLRKMTSKTENQRKSMYLIITTPFIVVLAIVLTNFPIQLQIAGETSTFYFETMLVPLSVLTLALGIQYFPQVLYILPFKTQSLHVIDMKGGIPLFTHIWDKKEELIDEVLFAGMFQGISLIMSEALQEGGLREISLERSVVLSHKEPDCPVAFIMVTTRSSQILRYSLETFAKDFVDNFEDCLANPSDVNQFDDAIQLVRHNFPYLLELS